MDDDDFEDGFVELPEFLKCPECGAEICVEENICLDFEGRGMIYCPSCELITSLSEFDL